MKYWLDTEHSFCFCRLWARDTKELGTIEVYVFIHSIYVFIALKKLELTTNKAVLWKILLGQGISETNIPTWNLIAESWFFHTNAEKSRKIYFVALY